MSAFVCSLRNLTGRGGTESGTGSLISSHDVILSAACALSLVSSLLSCFYLISLSFFLYIHTRGIPPFQAIMEDVSLGIEDLPYDLAGEIFRHLPSSADLLHIAQASKSLYYVAIRILYRDIHYETLSDFYHNLPFWTHNVPQNIAQVPRLTELVLFGYIPGLGDNGTAKPILPALMSYTGPTDFLKSSLRHCEMLQKLIFPDAIKDIDTVMLEALPYNARESVRFLDITVGHWDIEVLYAISMELPRLEVLKIKYEVGYPDQDMLISFGPEFFSRIPHLTIFHLYRPEIEYDELRCLGVHSHLSNLVRLVLVGRVPQWQIIPIRTLIQTRISLSDLQLVLAIAC
ncbi:hypothetical protein LENED_010893 [Lentinula edodes]|uniref:F-box domain-containing protein n=1 Tax=Lentinula edodes TaxID=5353 RepID=A0A1Q3ENY0_LENED|nr:hypothetical protein LENED_010893 [Lentinula edodes]